MSNTNQAFRLYRFLFQTLDPVHVGVGGYRLGRVDLPIAREPGTNLPKIPGTGISGAARHYAALQAGKLRCARQGAGEDDDQAKGHCGDPKRCPVCFTFGTLRSGPVAGRVRIFDARLLLFPVATFHGPVWVTSPQTLADSGLKGISQPAAGKARVAAGLLRLLRTDRPLNLGWLMVEVEGELRLPDAAKETGFEAKAAAELLGSLPDYVRQRLVLVGDDLFSTIVNSNLEVRTSVSIDPETGAAKKGALFTYEALPRATFLYLDVVEENKVPAKNDPAAGTPFPWPKKDGEEAQKETAKATIPLESWKSPLDVVTSGFRYFEFLGVGGMATRGFGRLKQIACREVMPQW